MAVLIVKGVAHALQGKWWTLCKETGGGLLLLGAICIAVNKYVALGIGGPGFAILMVGVVGSIVSSRSESEADDNEFSALDEFLPVVPATKVHPPMLFYGPSSWFPWFGSKQPDMTFRVGIAIPGVLPQMGGAAGITRLQGEARETAIEELLNRSPITEWLRAQRDIWHWEDEPAWHAYGSGYAESSEYRFMPHWSTVTDDVLPFCARTSVVTGRQQGGGPALHVCCDVFVNLLRLDSERRIAADVKDAGAFPAPAAFSLEEAAEILVRLWPVIDVAALLVPILLPEEGEYGSGEVGMWLAARSVSLGRALDLSSFRRVDGAADTPDPWVVTTWPANEDGEQPDPRRLVITMFHKMLEDSGYRGLSDALTRLTEHLTLATNAECAPSGESLAHEDRDRRFE